jgi:hypothetical protein
VIALFVAVGLFDGASQQAAQTPTKLGGDDYPGFNLAEWKKNRRLDDGIGETLERLINGPAASEVVAAVQAESKAAEFNPARLRALLERIERDQQDENDIEAILLSL